MASPYREMTTGQEREAEKPLPKVLWAGQTPDGTSYRIVIKDVDLTFEASDSCDAMGVKRWYPINAKGLVAYYIMDDDVATKTQKLNDILMMLVVALANRV